MHRREFVAGTAVAATVTVAGCGGSAGGGGGGGVGGGSGGGAPASAARSYFQAFDEGNLGRVQELTHPDGPAANQVPQNEEEFQQVAEFVNITVEGTEVIEQGDGIATVEMTLTTEVEGEEQTQTNRVELRRHNGQWKIYSGASTSVQ